MSRMRKQRPAQAGLSILYVPGGGQGSESKGLVSKVLKPGVAAAPEFVLFRHLRVAAEKGSSWVRALALGQVRRMERVR